MSLELNLIFATDSGLGFGNMGDLPWREALPEDTKEDLSFFQKNTFGEAIVMGRNTFESLGRLLHNRTHIVITSRPDEVQGLFDARWGSPVLTVPDLASLQNFHRALSKDLYVIGGTGLIEEVLDKYIDNVDTIYQTTFRGNYPSDVSLNLDRLSDAGEEFTNELISVSKNRRVTKWVKK